MEFVEGETLENLIKRSGRLEVKLALEIVTQVAAGLLRWQSRFRGTRLRPGRFEEHLGRKSAGLFIYKTANEPIALFMQSFDIDGL
jgi:hypothetical protein